MSRNCIVISKVAPRKSNSVAPSNNRATLAILGLIFNSLATLSPNINPAYCLR